MTVVHRNRTKQVKSLKARLAAAAEASREAAREARTESDRRELLKQARRYEVTAGFEEWLSSPGLLPPD